MAVLDASGPGPDKVYLGIDLSTQSITVVFLEASTRRLVHLDTINFDTDLPKYGTKNGMNVATFGGKVTSPVSMWLEGLDILLRRQDAGLMSRVIAVSGSAQQHGSVYWNLEGLNALRRMNPLDSLATNLYGGFTLDDCPIWADSSTQADCDAIENAMGGAARVASITGSRAYCRFTGPQIAKIARTQPMVWSRTARVSLVSSFLSSLLVGRPALTDTSDASGMNLLNIFTTQWSEKMMSATAPDLKARLGSLVNPWEALGPVSPYVTARYGLPADCLVIPASGDNNCSLVGMGLTPSTSNANDEGTLMISLGTSDTLVGLTNQPRPSVKGHVMVSPRGPGEYFCMLCYKNGAIAREMVRDQVAGGDWNHFSQLLKSTPPGNGGRMGLYLKMEEIIPLLNYTGIYRADGQDEHVEAFEEPAYDVRAVVEARFMSMRVHAENMGIASPKRILATGGGSLNPEIMQVLADIFGCDVFVANTSNAAALGAALRAEHGFTCRRKGQWVDFQATEPEGLKRIATPSIDASKAYTPDFLQQFAFFEREGHLNAGRESKV